MDKRILANIEVSKFIETLQNKRRMTNGDIDFEAIVTYQWLNNEEIEQLRVSILQTTWECGIIHIEDGKKINSDITHTELNPDFQSYSLQGNALVVEGSSPKMGGKYKVKIIEA